MYGLKIIPFLVLLNIRLYVECLLYRLLLMFLLECYKSCMVFNNLGPICLDLVTLCIFCPCCMFGETTVRVTSCERKFLAYKSLLFFISPCVHQGITQ